MSGAKKKLEILDSGLEQGVIDKEEHGRLKKSLKDAKEKEFENIYENTPENTHEDANEDAYEEGQNKPSEKALLISMAVIGLLFISILAYSLIYKPKPQTLEDLHVMNLNGKLKPEQGYIYKRVYSFVALDNLWYTQLKSPKGTKIYSLALRYSPKELKGIVIEGRLDKDFFDSKSEFFVSFDPTGKDFSSIALAVADFNTHMSKVFEKTPIAACDRNETDACSTRPIVTCEDSDKLVLYIKEAGRFRVYYKTNCIVIEGNGFDLVKGADRILYNLYNIMEQEEY